MPAKTKLISDKELYDSIVDLIKKAKSHIKISSPWIYNCDHILDELISANSRGAKIAVVMREPNKDLGDKNYYDKLNAIKKLKEANADIIYDPYVHEKVVISDGKEIIVSSANLIGTSLTRNGESGTYTNDPVEIEKYQQRIARKYKKTMPEKEHHFNTMYFSMAIIAVIIIFAIVLASTNLTNSNYTVTSLMDKKPLNEVVTVSGTAASIPEAYEAKSSGKTYQQFYITDGSSRIKVFCYKDTPLTIKKDDTITVTGKFILFSGEYEIAELNCSEIKVV